MKKAIRAAPALLLAALPILGCSGSAPPAPGNIAAVSEEAQSPATPAKLCTDPLPLLCEKCADGTPACAHWVQTAGTCTVEICAPMPECYVASDCHGALPQLCEICSTGKSDCAHFACVFGKCQTEICE